MKIETGQGTIPLITLLGIWSISALNALPGLTTFVIDYTFHLVIREVDRTY